MKEYKRIFYFMLIPIIFIISNIIAPKITSIAGFPINPNVFIYPIMYFLLLLLVKQFNKKDAFMAIIFTTILELIVIGIFELTLLLPIENKNAFNISLFIVLKPNYLNTFASVITFIISGFAGIKLYNQLNLKSSKISFFLTLISILMLDTILYTIISGIIIYSIHELSTIIVYKSILFIFISIILCILLKLFSIKKKVK